MSVYSGPNPTDSGLVLSLDVGNFKNYPNTGITLTDSISGTIFTINNSSYIRNTGNGVIQITRANTANNFKAGGGIHNTAATGVLTVPNFLYNNHTWEVWFKLDSTFAGNNGANSNTEGYNALVVYDGYHAGYMFTSSDMIYMIWNAVSSGNTCASWTVGTSGAQINGNTWYQIAVTRTGNTFTPYLNGAQTGTGSTQANLTSSGIGTNNRINIGKAYVATDNTSVYVYYSNTSFSNMKMYNRALSSTEIQQNFNALRGRFGI
jgi:hypothetical protein